MPEQSRFPRQAADTDRWAFLTITTTEDIADVISITVGPKRAPDRYSPWVAGVTLLVDARGVVFGGILALSRVRVRTIALPLGAIIAPNVLEEEGDPRE